MRQALRAGQGLREDWKALKRKGKDIREDGEGGETPSVSGVLWRELGWDGNDGAGRIMTYGIMGRNGGQDPLGPHKNPQSPQCSLENTLIS